MYIEVKMLERHNFKVRQNLSIFETYYILISKKKNRVMAKYQNYSPSFKQLLEKQKSNFKL